MAEDLIFKKYVADIFDVKSKVEVFFTQLLNEETLATQWKEIRNYVALNQFDLEDEFERWNFYLFYVVDTPMTDLNLKYEIEHDTISSRKMVVDYREINDDVCEELMGKYIKYDIENKEKKFTKAFTKNELVARIVNRIKEELE